MTTAVARKRVVGSTLCSRNDVNSGRRQEGSGDGALAALIFPCSCDDNGSSNGAKDSTLALLVIPCSCSDNGSISMDDGTLALLICKQEGGMMKDNATASRHVARGGDMRRADARQRWHDKR